MGLEDFERDLAASKTDKRSSHRSHRDGSQDREHRSSKHHHSRKHDRHEDEERHRHRHRRDGQDADGERRHHHKRSRDDDENEQHRSKRQRSVEAAQPTTDAAQVKVFDTDDEEDEWVEKEANTAPPTENILDQRDVDAAAPARRDAWMQEPSALDIEVVRSRKPEAPQGQFVSAKHAHDFKMHESEVKSHLADLEKDFESEDEEARDGVTDEPAQHDVPYTFGDSGSNWRMTKLKAVYRQAEDEKGSVDEVALKRYASFRDFDDAREEARELERREMYGKEYVGIIKPSGELFQERKLKADIRRSSQADNDAELPPQGTRLQEQAPARTTVAMDSSTLNKLKAQLMKAKLRKAPEAAQLEAAYEAALQASGSNASGPGVVVLKHAENRMLAGDRSGEVTSLTGKRARERGLVEENEDMTIEDMVRNERRTKGMFGGEDKSFAERIAKDGKFENDLDYIDDNAAKLSKRVVKSEINLRNTAIGDFQKMQRILDTCPLCYHEESGQTPTAPVVSLATRTYLTLATEPEIVKHGAVIVPIQHRFNLLECDDDEWEEIRNFMKSLTRFYDSLDKSVVFYENAAHMHSRRGHAALVAVPLPHHMAENSPAYFRESILSSDEQWSQHKPIIDTMALTQKPGYGKQAFRKSMAKEMPYFHVWFTLDGGMGHVIEDDKRWPKGDLFAREIFGGMLDRGPEIIERQGRWEKGDPRVASFRKRWSDFDWTKALVES